tara:strand:+ start:3067 stop:3183 length:117 start_codon:yes stop_codon:yes gene_type:complete
MGNIILGGANRIRSYRGKGTGVAKMKRAAKKKRRKKKK